MRFCVGRVGAYPRTLPPWQELPLIWRNRCQAVLLTLIQRVGPLDADRQIVD
jgi:hypothetical protein